MIHRYLGMLVEQTPGHRPFFRRHHMDLYPAPKEKSAKAEKPVGGKKPSGFSYVAIWTYSTHEKSLQMCLHLL